MAKKHWIYIKRGLSESPKHRAAMGECIWLYMHIIDRADWETGIVYEWKDQAEADEMGMPIDTLRRQRQKLEDGDYIRCQVKQYGQEIKIMEWKNPRDYGAETQNPRVQGSHETIPQDGQGLNQVTRQVKTPTSSSLINNQSVEWLIANNQPIPQEVLVQAKLAKDATDSFERELHFNPLAWSKNRDWEALQKYVVSIYAADNGVFKKFQEWREGAGKYKGWTNGKILQAPRMFIDGAYPEYDASQMYAKKDNSHAL